MILEKLDIYYAKLNITERQLTNLNYRHYRRDRQVDNQVGKEVNLKLYFYPYFVFDVQLKTWNRKLRTFWVLDGLEGYFMLTPGIGELLKDKPDDNGMVLKPVYSIESAFHCAMNSFRRTTPGILQNYKQPVLLNCQLIYKPYWLVKNSSLYHIVDATTGEIGGSGAYRIFRGLKRIGVLC
jgi:hypothetical protein